MVLPRPARSASHLERAPTSSAAAGAALFVAVVLGAGWIALWLDSFALWIVAPLGAAVLASARARDGAGDAGLHLRLRGNLPWYGLSVLVPPACVLAVLGLGAAAGETSFAGLTREGEGAFAGAVLAAIPWLFVKNIVQEVGWRGYLTPKLRALGLHDLVNHATVGVVWAIWHIPYYVGILAAGSYDDYTSLELAPFLAILFPGLVAGSIVLGELRLATDSVWPPVIAHTVANALVFTLLLDDCVVSSAALSRPDRNGSSSPRCSRRPAWRCTPRACAPPGAQADPGPAGGTAPAARILSATWPSTATTPRRSSPAGSRCGPTSTRGRSPTTQATPARSPTCSSCSRTRAVSRTSAT